MKTVEYKLKIKEYIVPMKKVKLGGPLGMGRWGFMAPELATFIYALVTILVILFTWTSIDNPSELLWTRMQFLSGTIALWVVFWLWPCKAVLLARIAYLLLMLGSWYPDTFSINRFFHSYDHVVAGWEQSLFGFQPALVFAEQFSNAVVSELMYMGYFSYYLFFVGTVAVVFFKDFKQTERVTYMIFSAFYICYVIFLVFHVAGPQYYYPAVGMENIAHGNFQDVELYFKEHSEAITSPGWTKGLFYNLVQWAHRTGECPTAAFPSSHVAIAVLVMLMVGKMQMWRWLLILAVPFIFLCLSTVYIYAHYAVDAIAGAVFAVLLFFLLGGMKLHKIQ